MTIPNLAAKYGLGTTYVSNRSGNYFPLKGMWIKNAGGTWDPVKTGWICHDDSSWERIYPTPSGIFTTNVANITANPYQRYRDVPYTVSITNTGDYDLRIDSANVADPINGVFATLSSSLPATPLLLTPGESTSFTTQVFGNVVGTGYRGNVNFTVYTGPLGYANVKYPVIVNVLPDYATIRANVTSVANLYYYQGDPATANVVTSSAKVIRLTNYSNGADLVITNATSKNGYFAPYNLTANTITFDFAHYLGNSATITVAPVSLPVGKYQDHLIVTSNASDHPSFDIPVTINVDMPVGQQVFETPGNYTWTVPPHVYHIKALVVGSGGGGGLSVSNNQVAQGGSGGGGGSGGYSIRTLPVTPGETLSISVGVPGGTGSLNVNVFYPAYNAAWSSFMNTYAVWFTPNSPNPVGRYITSTRELIIPTTGSYTLTGQASSNMIVSIDGTQVLNATSPTSSNTAVISLSQGIHSIVMLSISNGGVGGFAFLVQDSMSNTVWSTRTLMDPTAGTAGGSTTLSGSFGTVTVAGGNPGGGAYDDAPPPPSYGWPGYDNGGGFDNGESTDGTGDC